MHDPPEGIWPMHVFRDAVVLRGRVGCARLS